MVKTTSQSASASLKVSVSWECGVFLVEHVFRDTSSIENALIDLRVYASNYLLSNNLRKITFRPISQNRIDSIFGTIFTADKLANASTPRVRVDFEVPHEKRIQFGWIFDVSTLLPPIFRRMLLRESIQHEPLQRAVHYLMDRCPAIQKRMISLRNSSISFASCSSHTGIRQCIASWPRI